jgi:hypothetical protein
MGCSAVRPSGPESCGEGSAGSGTRPCPGSTSAASLHTAPLPVPSGQWYSGAKRAIQASSRQNPQQGEGAATARDGAGYPFTRPSRSWLASALVHLAGIGRPRPAPRAPPAPRPIPRPTRPLPRLFTSFPVIDRLRSGGSSLAPSTWAPAAEPPACHRTRWLIPPVTLCDNPRSSACSGHRRVPVLSAISRPDCSRCRPVATTSPSSAGPATSCRAVIRSYRVMGRRESLAAPDLPLLMGVTAPRSFTVAMS